VVVAVGCQPGFDECFVGFRQRQIFQFQQPAKDQSPLSFGSSLIISVANSWKEFNPSG
jgi:hypothetical protein